MPQLLSTTAAHQSALASYCRTGELTDIPGLNAANVAQYRRLVINIIEDMLQSAYPLACELLGDEVWQQLVEDFFAHHSCSAPQVWSMPKEFHEYLFANGHQALSDYPVLGNLLQFEWVEMELFMMEDIPAPATAAGALHSGKLMLNPEHRLLHYEYPVHLKKANLITGADLGNYYLAAHRHPGNGNVLFTNLSPALLRMLEYLRESPLSADALCDLFAGEYKIVLSPKDRVPLYAFFEEACNSKLILGFQA